MNITTKSGKTIEVDDESYVIDCGDGVIKHVFTQTLSVIHEHCIYTIDDADIDVIEETWTQERIDGIAKMVGMTAPQHIVDYAGYV